MSYFKLAVCGDLHLEALEKYPLPEKDTNDYIYEQLDKVVKYCRNHSITTILQAGDIFDTPNPKQESIRTFIEYLCKHNDLEWFFILGNHDYANNKKTSTTLCSYLTETKLLDHVHIYDKPTHVTLNGINFLFSPFPNTDKFEYLKDTPCIIMAHTEVAGSKNDNGMEIKRGLSRDNLDHKDFLLLGHLHREQKIGERIYYPGTMLQYTFGEPLPKGFATLNIKQSDTDLEVTSHYIPLETPYKFINVYIKEQKDFDTIDFNDSSVLYKVFLECTDLVVPKKLVDGSLSNIYKVVKQLSNEIVTNLDNIESTLSNEFSNLEDKEYFFDPLQGIESYLEEQGIEEVTVKKALDLISLYKNEFKSKR